MPTVRDLDIRDIRAEERDAARRMVLESYAEYATPLGAEGWKAYRGNIEGTLTEPGDAMWIVAVRGGTLVGSVLLYPPGTPAYPGDRGAAEPEVRLLAVPPSERGHRIGDALMDECERRAQALGASAVGLHTTELMRAAMKLYSRRGYERAPEKDFRPAPNFVVQGFRLPLR